MELPGAAKAPEAQLPMLAVLKTEPANSSLVELAAGAAGCFRHSRKPSER